MPIPKCINIEFFHSHHSHIQLPSPIPSQPSRLLRIHLILRLHPRPPFHRLKRWLPTIQLGSANLPFLPGAPSFKLMTHANRLVAAESLAHVNHAAFALAKAALELLALCGEGLEEGRREAFEGRVAGDEDALRILQALG